IIGPEGLGAGIGDRVATKVHSRIRGLVHMGLGAVRSGELNVVAGVDQCHYRNDSFVEIIAGGAPTTALDFNPGGIGSNYKHLSLTHRTNLLYVLDVPSQAASHRRARVGCQLELSRDELDRAGQHRRRHTYSKWRSKTRKEM